jgi:hypothetical protein
MDLRAYYRKVREVETQLEGENIVLVSQTTPEGGREGVFTEAPRAVAAKLISEGRARVSTSQEAQTFHKERQRAKEAFDQEEAAKRVQVVVIPSNDLRKARERN